MATMGPPIMGWSVDALPANFAATLPGRPTFATWVFLVDRRFSSYRTDFLTESRAVFALEVDERLIEEFLPIAEIKIWALRCDAWPAAPEMNGDIDCYGDEDWCAELVAGREDLIYEDHPNLLIGAGWMNDFFAPCNIKRRNLADGRVLFIASHA